MKKIFIFFVMSVMLFTACTQDEVINEQPVDVTKYYLNLQADMKGSSSHTTKLATSFDQATGYVYVKWEVGETINLLFVQKDGSGNITHKATRQTTVSSVDATTGRATFNTVNVPVGTSGTTDPSVIDPSLPFDLYGTAGGAGLDPTDNTKFVMKVDVGIGRATPDLIGNDVALVSYKPDLQLTQITNDVSMSFRHLGSLIQVTIFNDNAGGQPLEFDQFSITGFNSAITNEEWLYFPTARFDLVQNKFVEALSTTSQTGLDPLKRARAVFAGTTRTSLATGNSASFWQWAAPVNGASVNKLFLRLIDTQNNTALEDTIDHAISPLQTAKKYTINLSDVKNKFTSVPIPVIRFYAPAGSYSKTIKISKPKNTQRAAWIDLNQDNIREINELITNNGWGTNSFTVPSTEFLEVMGPIGEINFSNIGITKLELLNNPPVYYIDLSNNNLSTTNMTSLVNQLPSRTGLTQGELIVTDNAPSLLSLQTSLNPIAANKNWKITW